MKKSRNYLDFIPEKNLALPWSQDEEGIVTVDVKHKGIAAWIAQVAFDRPKISHVRMDTFGSYIWTQIDGEKSVYEIGKLVRERFGKEAEPLYERLLTFFRILNDNKYITYKK